jgi:hypothetical protein
MAASNHESRQKAYSRPPIIKDPGNPALRRVERRLEATSLSVGISDFNSQEDKEGQEYS